jgi:hypothetical protein
MTVLPGPVPARTVTVLPGPVPTRTVVSRTVGPPRPRADRERPEASAVVA